MTTNTQKPELKNCPFCRAKPVFEAQPPRGTIFGPNIHGIFTIKCACGCELKDTADVTVIRRWNTRVDDWQPIETAPKDGAYLLLWGKGFKWPFIGHFEDNTVRHGWYADTADPTDMLESTDITHWQPLPTPPKGVE